MQLWNDYEGKIIADKFTLGRLLRPEGRSALFALTTGPGAPSIIRITESLNDEGEMLTNWRRVADLKHDNLLSITHSGDATFETTPITYAVFEPTEANLAELLAERPLSQPEAMQVAAAIGSALAALHGARFIHEHVDAANLFAVGETVKLRSDTVRHCVIDNEFLTNEDYGRLVKKDVQDFGALLLRALTLQKKYRPGLVLPAPFDAIVPRALDGSWSLVQINKLVAPPPAPRPVAAPQPAATPKPAPAAAASAPVPSMPAAAAASATAQGSLPYPDPSTSTKTEPAAENPLLYQRRVQVPTIERTRSMPKWAPFAIAAAVLVAFILFLVHGSSSAKPEAARTAPAASQAAPAPTLARVNAPQPAAPASSTETAAPDRSAPPAHVQPGWYVIAYTFNHEQQALKRAEAILQRYPGLHPQVIAPHGTFLVALGGAMSRDQAEAIRNHARRAGMPRDTFVRNYGG